MNFLKKIKIGFLYLLDLVASFLLNWILGFFVFVFITFASFILMLTSGLKGVIQFYSELPKNIEKHLNS